MVLTIQYNCFVVIVSDWCYTAVHRLPAGSQRVEITDMEEDMVVDMEKDMVDNSLFHRSPR